MPHKRIVVAFFTDVVSSLPKTQGNRDIWDNLSSHKTQRVTNFRNAPHNVRLHFTPSYLSWLNNKHESRSKGYRDVVARGSSLP
ncbi:transposase [Caballeronia sp. INSB1]|uniref:transposase n=1 Tax=Caballeronia sp. INSB1 TaxID=2921751 RepID=UPI0020324082|nr:transposase [Caballeronia sp. INSB1]